MKRGMAVLVLVLLLALPGAAVQADMGCPDGVAGWESVSRGWDRIPSGVQTFGVDTYRIEVRHRLSDDGAAYDLVDVWTLDPEKPINGLCLATGVEIGVMEFEPGRLAVRLTTQPLALRVRVW